MSDPKGTLEVEDIRVFEAFTNPIRVRILRQLREPHSVKELAARMDVPPTRLYHHVNLLVDVGMAEVVETRKVGAMIEKIYLRTAGTLVPGPGLFDQGLDAGQLARAAASVVFDPAVVDLEATIATKLAEVRDGGAPDVETGGMARTVVSINPEDFPLIQNKIEELFDLLQELDRKSEGIEYGFSYAFYPVVVS